MRSDRRSHTGSLPETPRQVGPELEQTWRPTGLLDVHNTVCHVIARRLTPGKRRTPRHANVPSRDRVLIQSCQEHMACAMKSTSETAYLISRMDIHERKQQCGGDDSRSHFSLSCSHKSSTSVKSRRFTSPAKMAPHTLSTNCRFVFIVSLPFRRRMMLNTDRTGAPPRTWRRRSRPVFRYAQPSWPPHQHQGVAHGPKGPIRGLIHHPPLIPER